MAADFRQKMSMAVPVLFVSCGDITKISYDNTEDNFKQKMCIFRDAVALAKP